MRLWAKSLEILPERFLLLSEVVDISPVHHFIFLNGFKIDKGQGSIVLYAAICVISLYASKIHTF